MVQKMPTMNPSVSMVVVVWCNNRMATRIDSSPTTSRPSRSPDAPMAWISRTTPRISSQMPNSTAMAWTDLPGLKVNTIPNPRVMTPKTASSHQARPTSRTRSAGSVLVAVGHGSPSRPV